MNDEDIFIYLLSENKDKNEFIKIYEEYIGEKLKTSEYFQKLLLEKAKKYEIIKTYNNEFDNKIKVYLEQIEKEQFEDKDSIEHIKEFPKDIIENIIKDIFLIVNKDKYIIEIKMMINKVLNEKNVTLKCINILLCGLAGVGKSTLINSILRLKGTNKAKTGMGRPITQTFQDYISEEFPLIKCIDSKGIDFKNSINILKEEIINLIEERLKTNNPNNYIHCIWYCIEGLRFQIAEEQLLKELGNIYKIKQLPIIIVGTHRLSISDNKKFEEVLKSLKIDYPYLPTLAEDNDVPFVKSYGIKELRMLSLEKAMGAIESSYYQGIFKYIIETVKSKVKNINKIIIDSISKEKEKILDKNNEITNIINLKESMKNIFISLLSQYSSINLSDIEKKTENTNLNKNISIKDEDIINNFIEEFMNFCQNKYEQNINILIESHISNLAKILMDYQIEYNKLNPNIIEIKNENHLKDEILNTIENKVQEYYNRNMPI